MIEEAKLMGQKYVDMFCALHAQDPSVATTLAISSFVSCYAVMEPADRARSALILLDIFNDIQSEKFEDGFDFAHFMKQKLTEKGWPQ